MRFPEDLRYTKEHEWAKSEDGQALIGITDYAQDALGDVVYVELPEIGTELKQFQTFGVVESVKAVSDLFSPLSGKVVEINHDLKDNPQLVNEDPYGEGWMIKLEVKDLSEWENLLTAQDYKSYVEEEKEDG